MYRLFLITSSNVVLDGDVKGVPLVLRKNAISSYEDTGAFLKSLARLTRPLKVVSGCFMTSQEVGSKSVKKSAASTSKS